MWNSSRVAGENGHTTEHNAIARRLNQLVYVTDYGAKGNGVHDDTAAIQEALNTGRAVYFPKPANFYRITAPLTVGSWQTIRGDQSKIRGAGMVVADGAVHVTIDGLIIPNTITTSNGTVIRIQNCFIQPQAAVPCIQDTNSTQLWIADCHLERGEYGLLLDNSRAVTLENCVIQANNRGAAQTGIHAIADSMIRTLLLRGCHFENNPVGMNIAAAYETLLESCSFQGAGFDRITGRMALRACVGGSGTLVSKRVTGGENGFIQAAANVTPQASTWTGAGTTPPTVDGTQITFTNGGGTYSASRAVHSVGTVDEWLDAALTLKANRAGVVMVVRVVLDGNADVRVLNWTSTTDYQTMRFQLAGSGSGSIVIHPANTLNEALLVDIAGAIP